MWNGGAPAPPKKRPTSDWCIEMAIVPLISFAYRCRFLVVVLYFVNFVVVGVIALHKFDSILCLDFLLSVFNLVFGLCIIAFAFSPYKVKCFCYLLLSLSISIAKSQIANFSIVIVIAIAFRLLPLVGTLNVLFATQIQNSREKYTWRPMPPTKSSHLALSNHQLSLPFRFTVIDIPSYMRFESLARSTLDLFGVVARAPLFHFQFGRSPCLWC